MNLSREVLKAIKPGPCTEPISGQLFQESLGRCPWRVAIASMLLQRIPRTRVQDVLKRLLARWPDAMYLCRAEAFDVASLCSIHLKSARQLIRFSSLWLGDGWDDLRELPGVTEYVANAVREFCI